MFSSCRLIWDEYIEIIELYYYFEFEAMINIILLEKRSSSNFTFKHDNSYQLFK